MNPVVFVSSTYLDLKDIRKDVIRWINEFRCTPIGMEFFGSAQHTMNYIYDRINSCTNFFLISNTRYGSIPKGKKVSVTQLEYEKAKASKNVMCFVREESCVVKEVNDAFTKLICEYLDESVLCKKFKDDYLCSAKTEEDVLNKMENVLKDPAISQLENYNERSKRKGQKVIETFKNQLEKSSKDFSKLVLFRQELMKDPKLCKIWKDESDLQSGISVSLHDIIMKSFPAAKQMDGKWIAKSFRDPHNKKEAKDDIFTLSSEGTQLFGYAERPVQNRTWRCKGYAKGDVVLLISDEEGNTSSSSINCGLLKKCPGHDEYNGYYLRYNTDGASPTIEKIEINSFARCKDDKYVEKLLESSKKQVKQQKNMMKALAIVIPSYNEAHSLPVLLDKLKKYVDQGANVIVVDDSSSDNTLEVVNGMNYGKKLIYHRMPNQSGTSRCIIKGVEIAEEKGLKYIITMDADGQHDPEFIPRFFEYVEKGQFVCGNRFRDLDYIPSAKITSNCFASLIARQYLGLKVPDIACGFRAFSVEDYHKYYKPENCSNNFEFIYSMLFEAYADRKDIAIIDMPAIYHTSDLWSTSSKEIISLLQSVDKRNQCSYFSDVIKHIEKAEHFVLKATDVEFNFHPVKIQRDGRESIDYLIEADIHDVSNYFRNFSYA